MTAGQLAAILAAFPADEHVTVRVTRDLLEDPGQPTEGPISFDIDRAVMVVTPKTDARGFDSCEARVTLELRP